MLPSIRSFPCKSGGLAEDSNKELGSFLQKGDCLTTSQVLQALGVSRKKGASAIDTAVRQLQREYYITVDGSERKISAKGEFYGWPVNRYRRVVDVYPVVEKTWGTREYISAT
jgi:hypothetical protein